eukprot:XP_028343377.1 uncharacterized protein LOC114485776 [Physeter catodon]
MFPFTSCSRHRATGALVYTAIYTNKEARVCNHSRTPQKTSHAITSSLLQTVYRQLNVKKFCLYWAEADAVFLSETPSTLKQTPVAALSALCLPFVMCAVRTSAPCSPLPALPALVSRSAFCTPCHAAATNTSFTVLYLPSCCCCCRAPTVAVGTTSSYSFFSVSVLSPSVALSPASRPRGLPIFSHGVSLPISLEFVRSCTTPAALASSTRHSEFTRTIEAAQLTISAMSLTVFTSLPSAILRPGGFVLKQPDALPSLQQLPLLTLSLLPVPYLLVQWLLVALLALFPVVNSCRIFGWRCSCSQFKEELLLDSTPDVGVRDSLSQRPSELALTCQLFRRALVVSSLDSAGETLLPSNDSPATLSTTCSAP